jgi:hypothetical protein
MDGVLIGAEGEDANLRDFLETHFEIISLDMAVAETAVQLRHVNHGVTRAEKLLLQF